MFAYLFIYWQSNFHYRGSHQSWLTQNISTAYLLSRHVKSHVAKKFTIPSFIMLDIYNYFVAIYILLWSICSKRPRSKWDQEYTGEIINPVNSSSAIIRETHHLDSQLSGDSCVLHSAARRGQAPWPGPSSGHRPATAANICGFYQTTKNRFSSATLTFFFITSLA